MLLDLAWVGVIGDGDVRLADSTEPVNTGSDDGDVKLADSTESVNTGSEDAD